MYTLIYEKETCYIYNIYMLYMYIDVYTYI